MSIDEKAFMEAWEQVRDGSTDCCLKHRMQRFLEAYEVAKAPVSVSLEKCAVSASQWHHGKKLGEPAWNNLEDHIKLMYIEQTKAVLDAAGVKYAD